MLQTCQSSEDDFMPSSIPEAFVVRLLSARYLNTVVDEGSMEQCVGCPSATVRGSSLKASLIPPLPYSSVFRSDGVNNAMIMHLGIQKLDGTS